MPLHARPHHTQALSNLNLINLFQFQLASSSFASLQHPLRLLETHRISMATSMLVPINRTNVNTFLFGFGANVQGHLALRPCKTSAAGALSLWSTSRNQEIAHPTPPAFIHTFNNIGSFINCILDETGQPKAKESLIPDPEWACEKWRHRIGEYSTKILS